MENTDAEIELLNPWLREESLGRTAQAKTHYRRAMQMEGGEMRYRARARDALESIEYFE